MIKGARIFERPGTRVFETDDPERLAYELTDDALVCDGEEIPQVTGKSPVNLRIAEMLYKLLESNGNDTHYVRAAGEREIEAVSVKYFPLSMTCRNVAAGAFAQRMKRPEGETMPVAIVEVRLDRRPARSMPAGRFFTEITEGDAKLMQTKMIAANNVLKPFFALKGLVLADFTLEFGRDSVGRTRICSPLHPDSCRLWDKETHAKIDRDRFRNAIRGTEAAYSEILRRLAG